MPFSFFGLSKTVPSPVTEQGYESFAEQQQVARHDLTAQRRRTLRSPAHPVRVAPKEKNHVENLCRQSPARYYGTGVY